MLAIIPSIIGSWLLFVGTRVQVQMALALDHEMLHMDTASYRYGFGWWSSAFPRISTFDDDDAGIQKRVKRATLSAWSLLSAGAAWVHLGTWLSLALLASDAHLRVAIACGCFILFLVCTEVGKYLAIR